MYAWLERTEASTRTPSQPPPVDGRQVIGGKKGIGLGKVAAPKPPALVGAQGRGVGGTQDEVLLWTAKRVGVGDAMG